MSARDAVRDELAATVVMTLLLMATSVFMSDPAMADSLPQAQSQGAVQFISGGVGKDESDAMKSASADYPLMLEFASVGAAAADGNDKGEFVADVNVDIRDGSGTEVLHTRVDGPLLLVRVPPGHYSVNAEWRGVRKQMVADVVSGAHKRVVMAW